MLNAYLKALKKETGKSLQQIAEGCEIPLSTVSRIFSGDTENPTFHSIAAIVKFLGGSLDELAGIDAPPMKKEEKGMYERIIARHEKSLEEDAARIKKLENANEQKEKRIRNLTIICFALAIVIVFYLAMDIGNPTWGIFQY